ncbi:HAD family hydrolase [Rhodanobacter aciditrophus]|uniref:HAD family hydrolase n=1 Tax=Rhodanobacter aciditrophus TaxID=1623218 RepID=A0ABW4B1F2_9GAMM
MIKLVIFDWDGTLYNSLTRICEAMLRAGQEAGAEPRAPDDVKNIIGLSLDVAVDVIWPNESQETKQQIQMFYKSHYVASDQTPPEAYGGAIEFLEWLKEQGVQMAVATGKTRRGLDRVMGHTNTGRFFGATRCADETLSKPDPLMIKEILAELEVLPEHALMIGDTEYDLEMASLAGVSSVGVDYGAHHPERLVAHNPLMVVSNLLSLKTQLDW